jgi:hypothetical protein
MLVSLTPVGPLTEPPLVKTATPTGKRCNVNRIISSKWR